MEGGSVGVFLWNVCFWGIWMEFFWGRWMSAKSGCQVEFSWEISNGPFYLFIRWVLLYVSVPVFLYVVANSNKYLHSHFIVLLCYQYITFSHINYISFFIIPIMHPVLIPIRWFYQSNFIAPKLRFDITFNSTDL